MSGVTHKVLAVKTLSHFEHGTAQTREVAATMDVLDQVLASGE
jgi:hypothetical protein